jgi:hypothetical protein
MMAVRVCRLRERYDSKTRFLCYISAVRVVRGRPPYDEMI